MTHGSAIRHQSKGRRLRRGRGVRPTARWYDRRSFDSEGLHAGTHGAGRRSCHRKAADVPDPSPSHAPADLPSAAPRPRGATPRRPVAVRSTLEARPGTRDLVFDAAYREHAGAVFGLAHRLLGDRALAEEATQEVFLGLWRRPDRFDPARGCLRSFLLAECHSRSVDAIRAESARRRREERDGRCSELPITDVADDVCESAVHHQVALLIQALPEGEREAISLAYSGQVTYQQVAATLDTPEGTVKGRIRSGLRRLHAQIGELGIDPT